MDWKVSMDFKQTVLLGLSSSVTGGLVYSYIISIDPSYFAPALGVVVGLVGGLGIAAKSIFSGEKIHDEIPLNKLATHILFGIMALVFGYVIVFYFVQLPVLGMHDTQTLQRPVDMENGTLTLDNFLMTTLGLPDIVAAILGALSSAAIPMIFKKKIMVLVDKLKFNQIH